MKDIEMTNNYVKNAEYHWSSGKCKLNPQWYFILAELVLSQREKGGRWIHGGNVY